MAVRAAAFSLALIAAAFGPAAAGQSVAILPQHRWQVGDEARYERLRSRESPSMPAVIARTPVTIRVLEVLPVGHVISWRYGRTEVEGAPSGMPNEPQEAAQDAAREIDFVIELGGNGQVRALRNWEQVRDVHLAAIEARDLPKVPEAVREAMRDLLKRALETRQGVERATLREMRIFFAPYGNLLKAGQLRAFAATTANPFAGRPLPGKATLKLEGVTRGRAVVLYTMELDREKAAAVLAESLSAIAARRNQQLGADQAEAVAASVDVSERMRFVFDLESRWPVAAEFERRVTVRGRKEIEKIDFRPRL